MVRLTLPWHSVGRLVKNLRAIFPSTILSRLKVTVYYNNFNLSDLSEPLQLRRKIWDVWDLDSRISTFTTVVSLRRELPLCEPFFSRVVLVHHFWGDSITLVEFRVLDPKFIIRLKSFFLDQKWVIDSSWSRDWTIKIRHYKKISQVKTRGIPSPDRTRLGSPEKRSLTPLSLRQPIVSRTRQGSSGVDYDQISTLIGVKFLFERGVASDLTEVLGLVNCLKILCL